MYPYAQTPSGIEKLWGVRCTVLDEGQHVICTTSHEQRHTTQHSSKKFIYIIKR